MYSRDFPRRLAADGCSSVTTYGSFIEYLLALDPKGQIRAVALDFEGKNVLLYHLGTPPRTHVGDPDQELLSISRGKADSSVWWHLSNSGANMRGRSREGPPRARPTTQHRVAPSQSRSLDRRSRDLLADDDTTISLGLDALGCGGDGDY